MMPRTLKTTRVCLKLAHLSSFQGPMPSHDRPSFTLDLFRHFRPPPRGFRGHFLLASTWPPLLLVARLLFPMSPIDRLFLAATHRPSHHCCIWRSDWHCSGAAEGPRGSERARDSLLWLALLLLRHHSTCGSGG